MSAVTNSTISSAKKEIPYTDISWKTRGQYILSKFPYPIEKLGLGLKFEPEGWDPGDVEALNKTALSKATIRKIGISHLTLLRVGTAILGVAILVAVVFATLSLSAIMPAIPFIAIPAIIIGMKVLTGISLGLSLTMASEGLLAFGYNAVFLKNPPEDQNKFSHFDALELTTTQNSDARTIQRKADLAYNKSHSSAVETKQKSASTSQGIGNSSAPNAFNVQLSEFVSKGWVPQESANKILALESGSRDNFYKNIKEQVDNQEIHFATAYKILTSFDQEKSFGDLKSRKIERDLQAQLDLSTDESTRLTYFNTAYDSFLKARIK